MASMPIAASFMLSAYRTTLECVLSALNLYSDRETFDENLLDLTENIVEAIAGLRASGKPLSSSGGGGGEDGLTNTFSTTRISPETSGPSDTGEALATRETLDDSDDARFPDGPADSLRSALDGIAVTVGLEPPFPADDTQFALDLHAEAGRLAAADAATRSKLTEDMAAARLVVNRVSEILCPGVAVDHDALVARAQQWSAFRTQLQRRIAECYRAGWDKLGDELSTHAAQLMTSKEFETWWRQAALPKRPAGSSLASTGTPRCDETSGARLDREAATPTNPLASDGCPVRESTTPFRVSGYSVPANLEGLVGRRIHSMSWMATSPAAPPAYLYITFDDKASIYIASKDVTIRDGDGAWIRNYDDGKAEQG